MLRFAAKYLARPAQCLAVAALIIVAAGFWVMHVRDHWGWGEAATLGTLLSAFAALGAALATRDTVREMRAARKADSRPLVLLNFKLIWDQGVDDWAIYLVIGNYGRMPAADVRLAFNPPLINSFNKNISDEPMLSEPIPLIPPSNPDEEMRVFFDYHKLYLNSDFMLLLHRSDFDVRICYRDPITLEEVDEINQRLDLAHLAPTKRFYGVNDIMNEIIRNEASKFEDDQAMTGSDEGQNDNDALGKITPPA